MKQFRKQQFAQLLVLYFLFTSIQGLRVVQSNQIEQEKIKNLQYQQNEKQIQRDLDINCENTVRLLDNNPEQVILCAKEILHKEAEIRDDSDIITYDMGDLILVEYTKVSTVEWPYYPQGYQLDEEDIQPFRWFHKVLLIIPQNDKVTNRAYLYVGEHSNHPQQNQEVKSQGRKLQGNPDDLRSDAKTYAQVARETNSVVVVQYYIPNQPILIQGKNQTEDGIITFTWRKFIENAQKYTYYPLHLPMSVAVSEVMTWSQKQVSMKWNIEIEDFVIFGASKRGWTTWMSSLIDSRVAAIVPIVIDILNVNEQFREIYKTYGNQWPGALRDYNNQALTNLFNFSPLHYENLDILFKIMDPIQYRFYPKYKQRLEIPKYIMCASGDDFFLPQGSQMYYKYLPGTQNSLFYMPNTGHNMDESRAIPTATAFFKKLTMKTPSFPNLSYQRYYKGKTLQFTATYTCQQGLSCQSQDIKAKLWVAENTIARDFRYNCMLQYHAKFGQNVTETTGFYFSQNLNLTRIDDNSFSTKITVQQPENGWKAAFISFEDQTQFTITSSVYILKGDDTTPHASMPQGKELLYCTILQTNTSFE